jgi:flagellin
MLAIKNNLMADNAARNLGTSYNALAKSVERLSSGLRINSAKDDAAGLAVRELIRADVAALRQGSRNAGDAVSMLQSAEGGMAVIDNILVRMRELGEQAATGSYSAAQKTIMNNEFTQLSAEIDRIATTTGFNSNKLLDSTGVAAFSISLGAGASINLNKADMTATGLGLSGVKAAGAWQTYVADENTSWATVTTSGTLNLAFAGGTDNYTLNASLTTTGGNGAGVYTMQQVADAINAESRADKNYNAATIVTDEATGLKSIQIQHISGGAGALTVSVTNLVNTGAAIGTDASWLKTAGSGTAVNIATDSAGAITAIGAAIITKDTFRAELGYMMNRLEAAQSVNDIQAENLSAAESRISDVDVATEMAAMTRNQVLAQAGISMLTQANTMPQMAMQLLRG